MERQYKRSYKVYAAWNYQKEIEDLNKESEQGWQLIKGGCFYSRFKRNPDICYRYQIDYPGKIEDMGRYIETYREQGWEYINTTFNGWSYFRKLYDPSLPEEEYEIFTDHSSLKEMNGRWAKLATVLVILIGVQAMIQLISLIRMPTLPTFVYFITFVFAIALFIRGILIMNNPEKSKHMRGDGKLLAAFLLIWIVGNMGYYFLVENRPCFNSEYASDEVAAIPAGTDNGMVWNRIEIQYGDYYYVNVDLTADAPLCFSIVNEAGEAVYTVKEASVQESDIRLYLKRGIYTIIFSDYPGGKLNITAGIE